MARWLNLKAWLYLTLAAAAVILAGWIWVDQWWFSRPFSSQQSLLLEVSFLSVCALAIFLSVLLFRHRSAAATNLESKFRSLLDAAPDPIVIMNGDGVVCLVNARAEQLFQQTRGQLVGKSIDALLFQADRGVTLESSLADRRNSSAEGEAQATDLKARRPDGGWVPVEISFSPLETHEGTLTISILRDITDRKRAEHLRGIRNAVRRVLADSADLAEAAPRLLEVVCKALGLDLAVLWTDNRRPAEALRFGFAWNLFEAGGLGFQESARAASYSRGVGLAGRAWSDGRPTWLGAADADPLHEGAARQGLHGAFAFPVLCDAEVLAVVECFSAEPLACDDGLVDTLVRVGAQLGRFLKHQQAEEAVRASEARKTAILESALDAIITIDQEGTVLEYNPAAEKLFGHPRASAVGRRLADLIVPEPCRALYGSGLSGCRPRDGSDAGKRVELSLNRADGSLVPVELVITRIRSDGPRLFTCYIRDLTERVQAEQALRRTEEQFQQAQKMEAVGRLAGGVAHDFNNLLTVINGYSQSLLSKLPAGDPCRGPFDMINKAGNRAATLTRQLLAFSRRQVLEQKVFDLNGVVAEISKMLQRMIGEDVVLSVIAAPDLSRIRADQGRVEQILMNLAVNARDAMSQGGKLTIETRNVYLDEVYAADHPEVRPGPYVLLAVSDTGVGMDEATRKRIFEPFFTTKEVGKGTGLGLATVYGIIKQSGGHIAVYSEPKRGSTFKIYLPSTEERADPSLANPRAKTPRGKGTVLLVEDEEMVRTLSSQILQEQGYTVLEARHGKEALELSEADLDAVQLTVTDVVMPEMDGRDLARRLLSRKPDMKVLYVSGYTEKAIVRNGILEPDTIFLEKPFTPEGLARKVHEMLSA